MAYLHLSIQHSDDGYACDWSNDIRSNIFYLRPERIVGNNVEQNFTTTALDVVQLIFSTIRQESQL